MNKEIGFIIDYPLTKEFLRVFEEVYNTLFSFRSSFIKDSILDLDIEYDEDFVNKFTKLDIEAAKFNELYYDEPDDIEQCSEELKKKLKFLHSNAKKVYNELEMLFLNTPKDKHKRIGEAINSEMDFLHDSIYDLMESIRKQENGGIDFERTSKYELWGWLTLQLKSLTSYFFAFYWEDTESNHNQEIKANYDELVQDLQVIGLNGVTPYFALFTYYLNKKGLINLRGVEEERQFAQDHKFKPNTFYVRYYSTFKDTSTDCLDKRVKQLKLFLHKQEAKTLLQKYDILNLAENDLKEHEKLNYSK